MAKSKTHFSETYLVRYNIRKPNGYWDYGLSEIVAVQVRHGVNEKNNHDQALSLFMKKYPKAKVICVTYC